MLQSQHVKVNRGQQQYQSFNFYGEHTQPTNTKIDPKKQQYRTSTAGYDKKTKIVEVIDFGGEDTNNMPLDGQLFSEDDIQVHSATKEVKGALQRKDSDTMLNKLMENIRKNPALKNQNIRDQFKLHLIREEQDLHQYKNLLNAMAALFYTNHTP